MLRNQHSVFLFICLSLTVRADLLEWKTKTIELTAAAKEEEVEASFAFKNTGTTPVTIDSIKASCECIVPGLEKRTFASGEGGEIKLVVKLDGKVGRQEKTITVTTDDNPQIPILLTLRVNIPELVDIRPRLLVWRVGEEPAEKIVEIFMATHANFGLTEVKTSDPGFESRLETILPNRQYRLMLKPLSTAKAARSVITVSAKGETNEQDSSFNIYAQVR